MESPRTPLASEIKPSVMVSAREPAAAAVRVTLPALPAVIVAGLATVRREPATVAATCRLSWKAASLRVRLATATLAVEATRTLPSDKTAA